MKNFYRYAKLAVLPLLVMVPLSAQEAGSGLTKEQGDQILNELRQIRQLLEKQAAGNAPKGPAEPLRAKLTLTSSEMLGNKDAPLTMVEFTDYQCPFCQRFHVTAFNELKKNYIDTGKVRFYSRDLPLDTLHPNAMRAAMSARCAAEQGQFWKLRDLMGASPDKLDMNSIMAEAAGLNMDTAAFKSCVESEKYKMAIQNDVLEAAKIGADGTPTFVIGRSTTLGVDGEVLVGAQPYPAFDQKLKQLEAGAGAQAPAAGK
ncbi:MAG: thioredoxin domain-containing protein [Candidatus Sulfopaludibacter sp.]|nr:thioredoxin domain-containing protein [Candidatus Sulfopaludibacter sp.]